ncbi:MAG: substrate-binding domain-containing protein [Anaerolineae bacterium]
MSVPSLVRLAVGWEAGPLAEDLMTAYRTYRPKVTIQPLTMSSPSAIQAVTAGEMDLALIAAVDNAALEEMAPGLRYARVARDGLAVVVHKSSILNQISIGDLQALFSGEIVDWSALGQTGGRPLLAVQSRSTTTRRVFDEGVMQAVSVSTTARVFPNDETLLAYVSSTPLAIGYVSASHFQAEAPVAILAVDLLLPTRANIEKDQYPLTHGLYVVYRAESNANADGFRAFMQSARGHAAVRERNALP